MKTETWKAVKNYEGIYEVSESGKIKSITRSFITWNGGLKIISERIMANNLHKSGYVQVSLNINGCCANNKVHRLVAIAFIENPKNLPQVNHKDGNKQNNNVSNLEWCTAIENVQHAEATGLRNSKGQGNQFYGKKHTIESKRIISEKHHLSRKVIDKYTGNEYPSITAAACANGIRPVTLSARLTRYKSETRFVLA